MADSLRISRLSRNGESGGRDETDPARERETWILQAESTYLIRGPREQLAILAARLPTSVVDDFGELLRLRFGNAVGVLELSFLGRIEVRSGKWKEADFESMLAQVAERAAALPFAAGTATGLPHRRASRVEERIPYHVFVYLRHALSEHAPPERQLLPALRAILSDPHQLFARERRWTDIEQATRMDARTLEGIASGIGGRLPGGGRWKFGATDQPLPRRVDEPCIRQTVDVPENRFVRAFLGEATRVIDEIEALVAEKRDPFRKRLQDQCADMRRKLAPIRTHGLWNEVGEMRRVPAASTVLQRRVGYREIFRHYVRMRLSIAWLPPATAENLLELKDIATLYELWCFFEVERCVSEQLGAPELAGAPSARDFQMIAQRDLHVRWPGGVELAYNRTFERGANAHGDAPGRHSYSVPLRPDVALWVPGQGYHLFDAKFRLHERTLSDEWAKDARRDDLHKMHAYRDAISESRSAWVLYPGTVFRFFRDDSASVHRASEVPKWPEGIGAIPCSPRGSSSVLTEVISGILQPHD